LKNRGLFITTIVFFLLVNTTYYWEGKLALFAFPAFLILVIVYFGLAIVLVRQIYFLIKEKFTDKHRLLQVGLLTIVLALTFFKPFGFIDFDKLSGKDLLIADREGGGNCTTTLKLKDNNTFRERSVCFGVTEVKGRYELRADTIFFKDVDKGRESEYYSFALIKPADFQNKKIIGVIVRYKDKTDTDGHELFITKNDLKLLTDKSRTANIGIANSWAGHWNNQER
jgi:hypothetical protein